jgi:hypothetical protein
VELLLDRLLDLEDEVGLGPYGIGAFEYASASRLELVVGNRRSQPGGALHCNVVPVPAELVHSRGSDGNPVFVVLDLGRNADPHGDRDLSGLQSDDVVGRPPPCGGGAESR